MPLKKNVKRLLRWLFKRGFHFDPLNVAPLTHAQLLDPKESGSLTLESFHDVVSSSGEQLSDEEIRLMFQDADVDGDGKVHLS